MNTTLATDAPSAARRQQLLATLMSEHRTALLGYAEKLLKDRHTAEDIVQETLIRAWPHAERLYSTEGSVRSHETVGAEQRDVTLPDHADAVLTSVQATTLLRRLSPEHREVLLHTCLYDRTAQDTARILGIPAGTVKSRRHYALDILRRQGSDEHPNRTR
ncbi:sigma factor-like helix-turn-helix DNA-binding protein [Streptomyces lanatus]|uniref:Sigma factor-like helix-turn-helix DNA-binding protein n=1 Tax=Streptomyces lanatus TaxID=66900 RepID=A0ABV1XTB5_9ACTN|nr:sigma factor-like helix-turn-helix DNA-binding protein [Streptomyces lanatus]GHH09549.1 DNA-directed RNA polymerase sigma-70 factor [Streptomyces lanatus]